MKAFLTAVVSLTAALPIMFATPSARAVERDVTLNDITGALVPSRLLGGDREFGGNGPNIRSNVSLRIGDGGRALYADIYFHAKETKSDWSETEGRWTRKVWEAPAGQRIDRILSDRFSETRFTSKKAGFQILAPSEDWASIIAPVIEIVKLFTDANDEGAISIPGGDVGDRLPCRTVERCAEMFESGLLAISGDNHVHVKPSTRGNLVSSFAIVGDTGGDDISDDNNPKDDTRIVGIGLIPSASISNDSKEPVKRLL